MSNYRNLQKIHSAKERAINIGNADLSSFDTKGFSDLLKQITGCLNNFNFIDFALIFGSFAKKQGNRMSDIDIGLFTNMDIPLLELGSITAKLESVLIKKVELVILNDLYKKKPLYAYNIVTGSEVIICNDHDKLTEFKKNTFLQYFDVKHLLDEVDRNFIKRIHSNRFAERNYA